MKCEIQGIVYKSKKTVGSNSCNGRAATPGDSLCKQLSNCEGIIWVKHVKGEKDQRIKFLEKELKLAQVKNQVESAKKKFGRAGWINVYPDPNIYGFHTSKEEADEFADFDRIECVRIEY